MPHLVRDTFDEDKLSTGESVYYEGDVLATGVVVNIVDSQGNQLPLPKQGDSPESTDPKYRENDKWKKQ